MDNALVSITKIEQANTELSAILPKGVDLLLRNRVGDRQPPISRWHIVVRGREGGLRTANLPTGEPEAFKGLGAGHLVNQMPIDVEQRIFAFRRADDMIVPDFIKKRARARHTATDWRGW